MSLLEDSLPSAAAVWALLQRGVVDRRSPFRTPAVATVGEGGLPEVRTVVLREAEPGTRRLVLHSDRRAAKLEALQRHPVLAWHFWNPRHRQQLRARGPVQIHEEGPVVEAAWARLSVHQQRTYAASPAPGSPLEAAGDGLPEPGPAALEAGRAQFCVVECVVDELDLLELRRGGHRRVRLRWTGGEWTVGWAVP